MVINMKKKLLIGTLSIIPLSMLIYWFNLDNKLLYYGVRPILNKVYDSQKHNVKLRFFSGALTHLRIRLLRQPGIEGAEKTVFASRCVTALLAFPLKGRCRACATDEV